MEGSRQGTTQGDGMHVDDIIDLTMAEDESVETDAETSMQDIVGSNEMLGMYGVKDENGAGGGNDESLKYSYSTAAIDAYVCKDCLFHSKDYSQPTQQLLLTFPIYQNSATVFGTIEEALQSIIPNINERTSTDPKVKPSSTKAGTPAYCIDQLLDSHKLSQEQRVAFLAKKNYTARQLYLSSPLNSVLQEFYSWEGWSHYWKDRRSKYKKGGGNNAPNINMFK